MRCGDFKKRINDFTEGTLDSRITAEMKEHMETCISCREEYENIRSIIESLRRDAVSVNLNDSQKRGIKETILRVPAKKPRSMAWMRRIMYIAAIFMFASVGIYFARGVRVNIQPSNGDFYQAQVDELRLQVDNLKSQNQQLEDDKGKLQKENDQLRESIKKLDSEKEVRTNDWMMLNTNIGEALIEGKVMLVDSENKKIKIDVFRDDNTPNIDPDIIIPDGIYISTPINGESNKYQFKSGTVADLKVGDHISLHYLSKSKSARAILIWE